MKIVIVVLLVSVIFATFVPNCAIQHNIQQICYQCNLGYLLTNGICNTCDVGYIMQSGTCIPVSKATSTQTTQTTSTQNIGQLQTNSSGNISANAQIQSSSSPSSTVNSAQTIPGFSVQQHPCNGINSSTQNCVSCISGYILVNGICIHNGSVTATSIGSTSSSSFSTSGSSTTSTSSGSNSGSPASKSTVLQSGSPQNTQPGSSVLNTLQSSSSAQMGSTTGPVSTTNSNTQSSSTTSTQIGSTSNTNTQSSSSQASSTQAISSSHIVTLSGASTSSTSNLDPGCSQYDSTTSACNKCAFSYHQDPMSSTFKCIVNDPLCLTYNVDWTCKTCYKGYSLLSGKCIVQSSNPTIDPNCKTFLNGVCSQCYNGYYVNSQTSKCTVANAQCKTHTNNICDSCYGGYLLISGQCHIAQAVVNSQGQTVVSSHNSNLFYSFPVPLIIATSGGGFSDPYCRNFSNGKCVQCSYRTYFKNSICTQIDPNCANFDNITGQCHQCYSGYSPSSNKMTCHLIQLSSSSSSIPLVTLVSASGTCPHRSVPINGVCNSVSDQCKSWNAQAMCTSCYLGYKLTNGVCQ